MADISDEEKSLQLEYQQLTKFQISCILDNLEQDPDDVNLWSNIMIEIAEKSKEEEKPESFWQEAFNYHLNNVIKKKQLMDNVKDGSVKLTKIEKRLLNFVSKNNLVTSTLDNFIDYKLYQENCRVCLCDDAQLIYLFGRNNIMDKLLIVEKLNICVSSENQVFKDDKLPQFICTSCLVLLENTFKFKVLFEKSVETLKTLADDIVKSETTEYLLPECKTIENLIGPKVEKNLDKNSKTDCESLKQNGYIIVETVADNQSINLDIDDESGLITVIEFDDSENDRSPMDVNNDNYVSDVVIEPNSGITQSLIIEEVKHTRKKPVKCIQLDATKDSSLLSSSSNTSFQCDICGNKSKDRTALRLHLRVHSGVKPHKCTICNKEFRMPVSLKVHMRSHTGERPFVCEVCGKTFTQRSVLSYHRLIHTGEKNFKCDVCQYWARNLNGLKIHMRTHTGSRPYECLICSYKFTTSSNLHKHLRWHTGVKKHKICGKAFKTHSSVNAHHSTHLQVKEFSCQLCSYKASTKSSLRIHDRSHSGIQPYKCNFCTLKFSTASNMHKHVRNIHQQLKTHKCNYCDRCFSSRESARKHMVTHTGLKPYSCTECTMSYGWYNGLQKHIRIQHPGAKVPTESSFFKQLIAMGIF